MDLKQHIRHVPDFPKAGILFYDITTLLRNPAGLEATIDWYLNNRSWWQPLLERAGRY